MEDTLQTDSVSNLNQPEEQHPAPNETQQGEAKQDGNEEESADVHLLPQPIQNQSYGSVVQLPVIIPMQGNANRNDPSQQPMNGMVAPSMRGPYYSQTLLNTYHFQGNSQMPFGNEMSSGTGSISLAPVNPISTLSQNNTITMQGGMNPFSNQELRLHSMEGENQHLVAPYYINSNFFKPIEEIGLTNSLVIIEEDGYQVTHSVLLKMISDIYSDGERSSYAKDEAYLLQSLQYFLHLHQEFTMHGTVVADEREITKKTIDLSSLETIYNDCCQRQGSVDGEMMNAKDMKYSMVQGYNYTAQDKVLRNSKPGKPTVLTIEEEKILTHFILLMEQKQIRIPRDDVQKIVMGMTNLFDRNHPFKNDGPHRHWFRGFFKRNPEILRVRNASSPAPREQLKDSDINQFLDEVKRLRDLNMVNAASARIEKCSHLDETGFHVDLSAETAMPMMSSPAATSVYMQVGDMDDEKARKNIKRPVWTSDQLTYAVDQVTNGALSIKDASDKTGIPIATIRNHCKNPQMGARRGPPTVLSDLEENELERFLLKLDDCGYKANKEELGKLVMTIVNSDKRNHPFKEDGPHRHWYQGFYRRHKDIAARRKACSSSLCRQEAPPEFMKRFIDDLNEIKNRQNGNPPSKRSKLNGVEEGIGMETQQPLSMVPEAMDGTIVNANNEILPTSHMIPSANYEMEAALTKKGGRPKMPLFSVRPSRQRVRTAKIMDFIREYAVNNGENVDDLLWSLIMLRVRGSDNQELYSELERLYRQWINYVRNTDDEIQPNVMINPMMSNGLLANIQQSMAQTGASAIPPPNMGVDMAQMAQSSMRSDYPIQAISIDHSDILGDNDQNDMITRV